MYISNNSKGLRVMPPVKEEPKITEEEAFRNSLEDVATIAEKLSMFCESVEDLVGMVKLAIQNEGQLRLIISLYKQGARK